MLEVKLLGKFEVSNDGKPIAITSRPAQSLFAYLILSAGIAHRREKLAGLLWPDSLEETARDNLRHALWRMRKALEATSSIHLLQADDVSIGFKKSQDFWLDAAELERLSDDASADELMAVLSNYQGELLPGFYDEWVILHREHLYSVFEHHMARLMSLLQYEKRWLDILDCGERWIKLGNLGLSLHSRRAPYIKSSKRAKKILKREQGFLQKGNAKRPPKQICPCRLRVSLVVRKKLKRLSNYWARIAWLH